jgi:hypothetical protein
MILFSLEGWHATVALNRIRHYSGGRQRERQAAQGNLRGHPTVVIAALAGDPVTTAIRSRHRTLSQ